MNISNAQPNGDADIPRLPPPPNWTSIVATANDDQVDRRATLRARLGSIYRSLCAPEFINSLVQVEGAVQQADQLKTTITLIESELENIPTIKVALLGPSRHGKSTLLNALAACSILPMSDIKPCTASIVSLKRDDEWGFQIQFITKRRLESERRRAVEDAREYLARCATRNMGDDEPDDPRYLHTTLQRFIQLCEINPDLPPSELVASVASAAVPPSIERLLGQIARPRAATTVEQMQLTVERYLSTKDILWTIVDTCEISGPFNEWHPNLQLIDLPGTNDTDPQRTHITNSLRRTAKAVAICTSDSNLGNDIQSWLRNSSVLGDYLEATDQSRQHLFILRTKFDSYHPEIDESDIDAAHSEETLYRAAINRHKQQQTDSYREMLRSIASPLLPMGASPEEIRKREEMIARINGIRVFFVSALAHEAFEGRLKATQRQKRRLSEHFNDDPQETGIPELKQFVNNMAETYLTEFYYDDLERQLETGVDRLVRFFRQQWTTREAEVSGGSRAIADLVEAIDHELLPWMKNSVQSGAKHFEAQAAQAAQGIKARLQSIEGNLKNALGQRRDKWNSYYWNSLKAASRKKGVHTTSRGDFLDITQDICGMFVDALSLSWSSYRDDFIRSSSDMIADELTDVLQRELDVAAATVDMPEATAAIDAIVTNLSTITRSHRETMRRQVDEAIRALESIRKPAYEAVQELMAPTYQQIAAEGGPGCQQRMRNLLIDGANANVGQMWDRVTGIVLDGVDDLGRRTLRSLASFGSAAVAELQSAANHLRDIGKVVHRARLLAQMEHIRKAALLLWQSLAAASQTLILAPVLSPPTTAKPAAPLLPRPEAGEPSTIQYESFANSTTAVVEDRELDPSSDDPLGGESDVIDGHTDKNAEPDAPELEVGEAYEPVAADTLVPPLLASAVYQEQKARLGRGAPDDAIVVRVIGSLQEHHWKMTVAALSESIDVPTFRLRSMLPTVQRMLNIDGQQTMTHCRKSDTVEICESLLQQEFSVDNPV